MSTERVNGIGLTKCHQRNDKKMTFGTEEEHLPETELVHTYTTSEFRTDSNVSEIEGIQHLLSKTPTESNSKVTCKTISSELENEFCEFLSPSTTANNAMPQQSWSMKRCRKRKPQHRVSAITLKTHSFYKLPSFIMKDRVSLFC